jgi:hydroxyacylglutathione hydrolase
MDNAKLNTNIASFCFNPFQENTYIITHSNKDCWIIDPGCYTLQEQKVLISYIEKNGFKASSIGKYTLPFRPYLRK